MVVAIMVIIIVLARPEKKEYDYTELGSAKTFYLDGQIQLSDFFNIADGWVGAVTEYHFEYPYAYRDGTYVLYPDIENDPDMQINPGYEEDFTYTSDRPIIGAWQIRDHNDFSNKCIVGDCNKHNQRIVMCIDSDASIYIEEYECDKWANPTNAEAGTASTAYCNNGLFNVIGTSQLNPPWNTCFDKYELDVNVYYVYNDNPDYEGYDPNWEGDWVNNFNRLTNYYATFDVTLNVNYYEVHLEDDSMIPGALLYHDYLNDIGEEVPGDVQVAIAAGRQYPGTYGYECNSDIYPESPCKYFAVGTRIRMTDYLTDYWRTLHEFGHTTGCPHTGSPGSLSAHNYVGDVMSYGGPEQALREYYLYECKISSWLLGEQR